MARPPIVRSMNYELAEGATDGSVKKANPNRTDFGFDKTDETRRSLDQNRYGLLFPGVESLDIIRGVVGDL
jgi:hypothetical protein